LVWIRDDLLLSFTTERDHFEMRLQRKSHWRCASLPPIDQHAVRPRTE
jgi:hypothetical protein